MSCDILGILWVLGCVVAAILLANRPLTLGIVVCFPWFWLAWMAAEQGAPFGSLMLFVDGAALLWLCVYLHWRNYDYRVRAAP